MLNRYRNALRFTDGEVGQVLTAIKAQHLWDNSVIILTSDHGQEFNDNHRNYWEHSSNFTRYQVQVPLLIHWPGKPAKTIHYRTSHYDVVPSLMKHALGIKNPSHDYSIGHDLFSTKRLPFILVSSYFSFGIIEPKRITNLFNDGNFTLQDLKAKPLPKAEIHQSILHQALRLMDKYFIHT